MPHVKVRDYQERAVNELAARLREGHRHVILQAATGAGKTVMACEMIRRAVGRGTRVLFLAHRRRLVHQCSGHLGEWGLPHGVVMRGEPLGSAHRVQVASRDTLLSRVVRNRYHAPPPADLVIIDEAHNCTAPEYSRLLELYPKAFKVGLTATPATSEGRGLAPYFTAIVEAAKTSELVKGGHLVPVRCYAPDRKGARAGKGLAGDPVGHWFRLAEGRPTVLFTSKCAVSREVTAAFLAAGVPAAHIDAHTPDDERLEVDQKLRDGRLKVVSNVGVWTEGVDVPELSCCILFRMAGSAVLFLQAVGRVMRPHPSKRDAVLIDHAGAVFRHGFPDEDREWSLDPDDTVDRRDRERRKKDEKGERTPVCCPACSGMFSGSATCPACGHKLPARMLPAVVRNELLVEARRSMTPEQGYQEKRSYWLKCLYMGIARGLRMGAAAMMYKSRFGEFPDPGMPDVPPPGPAWSQPVARVMPHLVRRRSDR